MPYDSSVIRMWAHGWQCDQELKREMAKQNYLLIHKKRNKRR
jgi:hypothetical protein